MLIKENREDFKQVISYLIYSKDGQYIGEVTNTEGDYPEMWDNAFEPEDLFGFKSFDKFLEEKYVKPEDIGRIKRERNATYEGRPLSKEYYAPSQSMEFYDADTNTWFNLSGQRMRDPEEYKHEYFGDEGYGYEDY